MPIALLLAQRKVLYAHIPHTHGGSTGDVLPLRLSQGYGLELVPPMPFEPPPPTPHKTPSDSAATSQLGYVISASQQAGLTQDNSDPPDKTRC